ncbi:MHYT domain signaling protein, putative [Talaromyces stipitatus ATCC 10500]|uniref:MHYT domain signaling protein, putative n=1 Tax=Talaromyces stipitatus (strain ATCC 10500 / CBS 375.48 / QM 6759 / NRRL 1006) TaxID=441959 RepID=B8M7Q9_TALSN|nr:MHYT domain signaling protein, putative [Talaromyces stipitatus ATCC 10500]EED19788.1 MHYT domain signaling protein, putative [Talaromyces stipitatus ATCC 10500]
MAVPTQQMLDGRVPMSVSYDGGYIALSYIVSVMGSTTCLELLHRRSSRSGLLNWFIGNRAIVLGDGSNAEQISYNIQFTIVSLVLPVLVLSTAFYAISFEEKPSVIRLLIGGFLTGAAICAMHYLGQLGISNYHCSYRPAYVVGAALIATVSASIALSVFFRWKAAWTNSWWRRLVCAALLAGAVSGMHWTAAVGTYYNRIPGFLGVGQLSRSQTVIICAALSFAACIILSICAIIAGGRRHQSTTRSRQLVLSCAFFDPAGRVMVSPAALLPTRKIVDRYINKSMKDDDFSRAHPAFLWAFRASHNWALVKGIIPSMKNTLQSNELEIKRLMSQRGMVTESDQDTEFNFDTIFKHFFCISAQNLADELRLPLSGLGELYHQVLSTVTQVSRFEMGSRKLPRLGKGQLMFTVRQLDGHEAARFMANGYRFAPIERVTGILSRRIHLSPTDLTIHLHKMRDYASSDKGYSPGVHLVAFGLRPTIREHFEVLTRAGGGMPLPSSTLPVSSLKKSDLELLNSMDGGGFTACLKQLLALRGTTGGSSGSVSSVDTLSTMSEESFATHLYRAMLELMTILPENIASAARFSAKPLLAPCHRQSPSDPEQCVLICFRVVSALDTRLSDTNLTFTPLRLFRVQEQVNDKISERERFIRELNAEFASYSAQSTANHKQEEPLAQPLRKVIMFPNRIWSRIQSGVLNQKIQKPGHLQHAISQESLVRVQQQQLEKSKSIFSSVPKSPLLGGNPPTRNALNPFINEILVSKEVTVDVARLDDVELTDISIKRRSSPEQPNTSAQQSNDAISDYQVDGDVSYSTASLANTERKTVIEGGLSRFGATYVDELYGLCLGREVRMKPGFYNSDSTGER